MLSNHHFLLQLTRSAVIAYNTKGGQARYDLSADLVRDLEVVDASSLRERITKFATDQKLRKKHVLVMLDESVLFQKVAETTDPAGDARLQQEFAAMLPFDEPDRRVIALHPKGHVVLIGTNGELYLQVVLGLLAAGVKVQAVAPISVYGKQLGAKLTPEQVVGILGNRRLAESADFLDLEKR